MSDRQLEDLRRRAYEEAGPLPSVALRPADAVGHVLREAVHARADLPAREVVAVDGWAVAGPGPWQLVAATPTDAVVPDGCAVAVEAGAALPPGTTAAVPRHGGLVAEGRLIATTVPGDNVRPRAGEVAAGTLLIPEGTLMTAGAAALAAAGGNEDVLVTGRPSVALLVTYDTDTDPSVFAATEALLPELLRAAGATQVVARRVPDTAAELRAALGAVGADVVVVTGAAGEERARTLDTVLVEARAEVVVDGARDADELAGTSGWLLARLRDGRLLVALPGDLRDAVAAVLTLARPVVHGLCGYAMEPLARRELDVTVEGPAEHATFLFVRGGRPTPDHGPATGHGMAAADALVLVPTFGTPPGIALPALPLP